MSECVCVMCEREKHEKSFPVKNYNAVVAVDSEAKITSLSSSVTSFGRFVNVVMLHRSSHRRYFKVCSTTCIGSATFLNVIHQFRPGRPTLGLNTFFWSDIGKVKKF